MRTLPLFIIVYSFYSCSLNTNNSSNLKQNEIEKIHSQEIINVGTPPLIVHTDNPVKILAGEPKVVPPGFFSFYKDAHHERYCSLDLGVIDNKGSIWFGYGLIKTINTDSLGGTYYFSATVSYGLCHFDGNKFYTYSTRQGLPDSVITALSLDKQGRLWTGTAKKGISCYDGKYFTNYDTKQGLLDNYVMDIFQDDKNMLWIGTIKGLCSFDGNNFYVYREINSIVDRGIGALLKDTNDNLWFGTTNGMYCYNGKTLIHYTTFQGLPDNHIFIENGNPMVKDNKGNIWLITTPGGISKLEKSKFTIYTKSNSKYYRVWSLAINKNGNIWIGSDNTIMRYNGNTFTEYPILTIQKDTMPNSVECIIHDSINNLYLFTSKGKILKYDGETFTQIL